MISNIKDVLQSLQQVGLGFSYSGAGLSIMPVATHSAQPGKNANLPGALRPSQYKKKITHQTLHLLFGRHGK